MTEKSPSRQGDLIITRKDIAEGVDLKPERDVVIAGSHNGAHTLKGAALVARGEGTTLVRVPEPTQLVHGSRHKPVPLAPGDYEIKALRERGDAADRLVED